MAVASQNQLELPPKLMRLLTASYGCDAHVFAADAQALLHRIVEAGEIDWVKKLEDQLAEVTGFSHVTVCGSQSVALYVALTSIGLAAGDEVLLSTYSPVFIADVIRHFDAHPVLIDVDKATLEIDGDQVEHRITDRTKAIIPVHLAGRPIQLQCLSGIANRRGISIIEDVGAASIAMLGRSPAPRGNLIFGASSADATRSLSNQLGYVCTNNHDAAQRARQVASQPSAGPFALQRIQFDCRPAQLNAAWEFQSLETAQARWRRRCEIATTYTAVFSGRAEFEVPPESQDAPHSWTQYVLRANLQRMKLSRVEFIEQARAVGINVAIDCLPIHMHPYYEELYSYASDTYPIARNEFLRTVTLPIDHVMTDDDVNHVTRTVLGIL